MINRLIGFETILDGFSLITKPGVKRFVAIPLAINILLFIGFFFLLKHYIEILNVWFIAHLPHWLYWLSTVLWILFFIGFLIIFIYTFVTISNLVAAPFNSLLSEKIELYLTGKQIESRSLWENVKDMPRIVGRQLLVLAYYAPRALILFILFFVPILQVMAPILWFLFHAWFMALTYLDYPTDNHRIAFKDVRFWMEKNKLPTLSFGIGVLLLTLIPFINFLAMPVAVAAATKLWIKNEKP